MNKGFLASVVVMTAAAGLGYWILSDAIGPSKRRSHGGPSIAAIAAEEETAAAKLPTVPSRPSGEFISLEGVFYPTGEELDLQHLLQSLQEDGELPLPRLVVSHRVNDAGVEDSSWLPPSVRSLRGELQMAIARRVAEFVYQIQPLMGTQPPAEEESTEAKPFGGIFYPLSNSTTEIRPSDLPK